MRDTLLKSSSLCVQDYRKTLQAYKGFKTPLPLALDPVINEYPRLVNFGVGMTFEDLKRSAKALEFWPDATSNLPPDDHLSEAMESVQQYLVDVTGWHIEFQPAKSPDYDIVATLYSNYTIMDTCLEPQDELEVIEVIQAVLQTDAPALWHYDTETEGYRMSKWTPPSYRTLLEYGLLEADEEDEETSDIAAHHRAQRKLNNDQTGVE